MVVLDVYTMSHHDATSAHTNTNCLSACIEQTQAHNDQLQGLTCVHCVLLVQHLQVEVWGGTLVASETRGTRKPSDAEACQLSRSGGDKDELGIGGNFLRIG